MVTDKAPDENISASDRQRPSPSPSSPKALRWLPRLRLVRRRTIWCPTWVGLSVVASAMLVFTAGWFAYGERFLSLTDRLPADVLVVEGWIGRDGIRAAVSEFEHGGYHYLVASGGLTSGPWEEEPTSYAKMAAREMIQLGVPKESVIVATADTTERYRTFESAVATWRALRDAGIKTKAFNVFTLGPHARRSALIFAKVNSGGAKVGVIGWLPKEYKSEPWWRSSDRSRELIDETVGYFYELLLNSARHSDAPETAGLK
jgi:uncharacterized SAM-binding protein YcdF (DUF218 family)